MGRADSEATGEPHRFWTDGAGGWVANEALFDALLAPATQSVLAAARIGPDMSVLDVGCGSGTLLAAATERGARVTGVDISTAMADAAANRVPQATVEVGDAQTAPLHEFAHAPFDRVVSRFGVMFFADPSVAFANIRVATAPDGTMTFACWRDLAGNPIFTLGTTVLTDRLEPTEPAPAPGGPGPVSLADPDRVREVLGSAGWTDIEVTPVDFSCDYGALYGSDGVEERLALILGTSIGENARRRLQPDLGDDGWHALVDDVRASLRHTKGDADTLTHPAAIWIVTARVG